MGASLSGTFVLTEHRCELALTRTDSAENVDGSEYDGRAGTSAPLTGS
jgi:hypothetical protein